MYLTAQVLSILISQATAKKVVNKRQGHPNMGKLGSSRHINGCQFNLIERRHVKRLWWLIWSHIMALAESGWWWNRSLILLVSTLCLIQVHVNLVITSVTTLSVFKHHTFEFFPLKKQKLLDIIVNCYDRDNKQNNPNSHFLQNAVKKNSQLKQKYLVDFPFYCPALPPSPDTCFKSNSKPLYDCTICFLCFLCKFKTANYSTNKQDMRLW